MFNKKYEKLKLLAPDTFFILLFVSFLLYASQQLNYIKYELNIYVHTQYYRRVYRYMYELSELLHDELLNYCFIH